MGIRTWIGFAIILVICAILVVADLTIYRPSRARLAEVTGELAVSETEHAYVAGHATDLARILDFLPEEPEDGSGGEQHFLSSISERLQSSGMTLTRVEPRKVVPYGSFTRRTFTLEVEGGFHDFANFLRYLETMPEIVTVNAFELHSAQVRRARDHSATLTVTVTGY